MFYKKVVHGQFVERQNRFISHVIVDNELQTVHVKNTGRCKELLIPGADVILEDFRGNESSKNRKTLFDLVSVYKRSEKDGHSLLVNMDSQAPNKVVKEWLEKKDFDIMRPEFTYGQSRIDFYMEKSGQKYLLEIKGCTLEKRGIGYFPDAPTERGVKHLYELAGAQKNGYQCAVGFVIQMYGIHEVRPNIETHAEFGKAMEVAKQAGVKIIFYECNVFENGLEIIKESVQS